MIIPIEAVFVAALYLHGLMKKVRTFDRRLSKKKKGSNNRKCAKADRARFYRRITAMRRDFQWKLALELVRRYDVICLEDLNLKGMQMLFGKKVCDLGCRCEE